MAWRVAKALDVLLAEVNAAAPNRSKASDGSIGDAAHASRTSDHNPWVNDGGVGVVTARDFTHHPGAGADMHKLAEHLRASRDPRIKYVIWNRRIFSSTTSPWQWRPYGGSNPHTQHLHLSVSSSKRHYDSTAAWGWGGSSSPEEGLFMAIKQGDSGEHVEYWQYRANKAVPPKERIEPDGDYGPATAQLFAKVLGKDKPVDWLGGGRMSAIEDKVLLTRLRRLRGINAADIAKLAAEVADELTIQVKGK